MAKKKNILFRLGVLALLFFTLAGFTGCSKTGISIQKPTRGTVRDECVVLIHGMGRTLHSMDNMQERLTAAGYHTVSLGYPSTKKSIDEIAKGHFPDALQQCGQFNPATIHFVSHSLGGIILRAHFKTVKPKNMGRVVMLSPPNHGSEVTDRFKDWWLYQWLNGPAGQQLGTDSASYPNQLGAVDYPVGIITGNSFFFIDYWLSAIIPGLDDGKVSVESARLEGMTDFLVVDETHPFIMDAEYVQDETLHFLENGTFKHQKKALAPVSGVDWFSFPSDN